MPLQHVTIIDIALVRPGDPTARWRVAEQVNAAGSQRQSIVFFHNPNGYARIECLPVCFAPGETLRHPPTTSGRHLRNQFVRTQAE